MNQALWIAKTGLDAQQTRMSVVSNNLANTNTTGFKQDRASFEDLLYQQVRQPGGASSAQTQLPTGLQIGTGVRHRMEQDGTNGIPEDTLPRLIQAHVDGLSGLPCKVCLLTDTGFDIIDRTAKVHQHEDLLHGVQIQNIVQQWDWPVAPFGEESKDYQIVHRVVASNLR